MKNIDKKNERKKVTFVTIDTNFKENFYDLTQIIAICAKKYEIIDGKLFFLESYEKLTYPVLSKGEKYNNVYHKLEIEKLISGTTEDIKDIFRDKTLDKTKKIKKIEFLKLKELATFVKGTTIVTNSKKFLINSLDLDKNNIDLSKRIIERFKMNSIIGILEDNRNILKLDRINKEYDSQFKYKLPSLKEVCEYYSITYIENNIENCFQKNILLIEIFEKMLKYTNENNINDILYKNIPIIDINSIENFKELYKENEITLKNHIFSNKKIKFFENIPKEKLAELFDLKISYIQIKKLKFKKDKKCFLKGLSENIALFCIPLNRICYFVNEKGKVIAVTKKDFQHIEKNIFNDKKNTIITRNLKTYLTLVFKEKNVVFKLY